MVSVTGTITLDMSMNGQSINCVASSEGFPERRANCSIGPFDVLYKPLLEIVPYYAELLPPMTSEVRLVCLAEGNPVVDYYNWECHPAASVSVCKSNTQNLSLRLADTWQKPVHINVTCTARNTIGLSHFTSVVNVSHDHNNSHSDCRDKQSFTPDGISDVHLIYRKIQRASQLRCLMETMVIAPVRFRWYHNGLVIKETNGTYDFEELPNGSRQLVVQDILNEGETGVITCEILAFPRRLIACSIFQSVTTDVSPSSVADVGTSNPTLKEVTILSYSSPAGDTSKAQFTSHIDSSLSDTPIDIAEGNKDKPLTFRHFWMLLIIMTVLCLLFMCLISIVVATQKNFCTRGGGEHKRMAALAQNAVITGESRNEMHLESQRSDSEPIYDLPQDDQHFQDSTMCTLPDIPLEDDDKTFAEVVDYDDISLNSTKNVYCYRIYAKTEEQLASNNIVVNESELDYENCEVFNHDNPDFNGAKHHDLRYCENPRNRSKHLP